MSSVSLSWYYFRKVSTEMWPKCDTFSQSLFGVFHCFFFVVFVLFLYFRMRLFFLLHNQPLWAVLPRLVTDSLKSSERELFTKNKHKNYNKKHNHYSNIYFCLYILHQDYEYMLTKIEIYVAYFLTESEQKWVEQDLKSLVPKNFLLQTSRWRESCC